MFEKIKYNQDTNIVFGVSPDGFYQGIINDAIYRGERKIDVAVYKINIHSLNRLKNECNKHKISLRLITNSVQYGKKNANYNDEYCKVYIIKDNHCKMFLTESYAYIGSFNFSYKNYKNIECGVEFTDSKTVNDIRKYLFNELIQQENNLNSENIKTRQENNSDVKVIKKTYDSLVRKTVLYENGITIDLFKDSINWYEALFLHDFMEDDLIKIATYNFNLNGSERHEYSLYSIITNLGKKDVHIYIGYNEDQCNVVEDYSTTEISAVVNLNKIPRNHSKVFLSKHYLHIGSANFSLGSGNRFECGVTFTDKKIIKEFERKFFDKLIHNTDSIWSSDPIMTESAIARSVLPTINHFFDIINKAGYSYEDENTYKYEGSNDEGVSEELRKKLFEVPIVDFENLDIDLDMFKKYHIDNSYIAFNIKGFIEKVESPNKTQISDEEVEDFISYLVILYDFLVGAEGEIGTYIRKYGSLDRRYELGED